MKSVRIGNDINVSWSIMSNGAPYSLEGLDVSLYLRDAFAKKSVTDFTVSENKVLWTFLGKDQSHSGKYSLELVINEGKHSMVTTDACDFVNLVSCSCKIGGNDEGNITTEVVDMSTDMGFVPIIIDEELSETSENAIANKAVTAELKKKAGLEEVSEEFRLVDEQIKNLERDKADASDVNKALKLKVDKIAGKGLSSNDFTNEEKAKLASLQNYDDSELKSSMSSLETKVDSNSKKVDEDLKKKADSSKVEELTQTINEESSKREEKDAELTSSLSELQHKVDTYYELLSQSPFLKINLLGYAYLDFAVLG